MLKLSSGKEKVMYVKRYESQKRGESDFTQICRDIARLAKSHDDIQLLLQNLQSVNWQEILDQDTLDCYKCRKRVCYKDVVWTPFVNAKTQQDAYCKDCAPAMQKEHLRRHGTLCNICLQHYYREENCQIYMNFICDNCKAVTGLTNQIMKEEGIAVWMNNERAKKKGLRADLTLHEWIGTLLDFHWKCAYCPNPYNALEHFVPIALDGGTTKSNCVPSCKSCNSHKSYVHPDSITSVDLGTLDGIRSYLQQFS